MNRTKRQKTPPPPTPAPKMSFASAAFGRDTLRYRAFIQALLDGQRAYDLKQGTTHAQTSLSAA